MSHDELMEAVVNGELDVVKTLLNNDEVDPSACYNVALFWALFFEYSEIIRLLLNDSRVLNEKQDSFVDSRNNQLKQILEKARCKKSAIVWSGGVIRREWRYLCPLIAKNITF